MSAPLSRSHREGARAGFTEGHGFVAQVNIGTLEMFYSEAPESMRSTASAMQLVTVALGNYLSSALVSLVMLCTTRGGSLGWIPDNLNRGRLDLFYTLLVVLSVLNLLFFLLVARSYKYKQARPSPPAPFRPSPPLLHRSVRVPPD